MGYNIYMNEKEPVSRNNNTTSPLATPTPQAEEGPYYKANSPERTRLVEPGIPGEKLTLTGQVIDSGGNPLAHAWLDFWQADGNGEYDNSGYKLRGHQYTDSSGRYKLETVLPGAYPGRTPHIHVKVRARDSWPVLTAQLFIPGVVSNKTDFIYKDALLMEMKDTPQGKSAKFNFVLSR
jgi:protocatechuate 3,4-dioxygenase beta subunit